MAYKHQEIRSVVIELTAGSSKSQNIVSFRVGVKKIKRILKIMVMYKKQSKNRFHTLAHGQSLINAYVYIQSASKSLA